MEAPVIVLIALALIFDYLNGFHDSSNIVATIISSRAMPPRIAMLLTASAEFIGPFLFGVAVAKTIGEGIVPPDLVTMPVILATLGAAILWNLFTWFFGIPSSSSHALIGGLVGAVIVSVGADSITWGGMTKVLVSLFISPLLGLAVGYIITKLVYFLARSASLKIN